MLGVTSVDFDLDHYIRVIVLELVLKQILVFTIQISFSYLSLAR